MNAKIASLCLCIFCTVFTVKAQTHQNSEKITLSPDEFGVFRYQLSKIDDVAIKLNKQSSDVKNIICYGGLCYRTNEVDCLPASIDQTLEIAWYDIKEKHHTTLELISCTNSTRKTIHIQLIP